MDDLWLLGGNSRRSFKIPGRMSDHVSLQLESQTLGFVGSFTLVNDEPGIHRPGVELYL